MGMDLEPIAPTPDAPKTPSGEYQWGRYNWAGWSFIQRLLIALNVDISEFSGVNDGDVISEETCKIVADQLEMLLALPTTRIQEIVGESLWSSEEDADNRRWLMPHIQLWRTCGGYSQY